jgi:exodeoxyribonuclease V alpha subunit
MEVVERPEDPDARVPDGAQESDAEPLRDYIDLEIERPANLGPEEKFDVGKATCEAVVRLVKTIGKRYGIKPEDVQVLCPMRVRAAGADELNQALQAALNPQAPPVAMSAWSNGTPNPNTSSTVSQKPKLQIGSPRETASVGDKVMQLRNDYQKGLYNGDVGFIEAIDHKQVVVDFRDGMPARTYTPAGTADIKLAYASTVHKSQGQEFPCVVIVVLSHQSHMFSKNGRNLFYTAVTRGKKLVFVVHDKGAIEKALSPPRPRQTLLRQRLQGVPVRFRTGPAVPPEAATPTTPPT